MLVLNHPFAHLKSPILKKVMEAVNIYPILLKWKENKRGLCPLGIAISFQGKRAGIEFLHQQVRLSDWDDVDKRVKTSDPGHLLLNALIENRVNLHKNFFLKRHVFNLSVTKELIKKYLEVGGAIEDFYTYAHWVIENKTLSDGKPYAPETKRTYKQEIVRLQTFRQELTFKQLTPDFLRSYKIYLQTTYKKENKKPLDNNSIWKAFKFIRMVYNEAVKNETILPDGNPFKVFDVGAYKQDLEKIKYLELQQVEAIERTLTEKRHMIEDLTYYIGWRFLAMCVLGIRISDAMHLSQAYFNDAGDLDIKPYKTRRHDNRAQVPIVTERQRRYLQVTLQHTLPDTDPKSFRTTFNNHLKIIAAHAGININLTSHVGRHTMGSFLVDANIEEKTAMAMLGVKSDKTIKNYMHLKQSKLKSEAAKLGNIM